MDPKTPRKSAEQAREDPLKRLVQQAKENPAFFHSLVFDTEKVLSKVPYLNRKTKGALVAIAPEEVIRFMAIVRPGGLTVKCSITCGDGSCDNTCGQRSCSWTCGNDSCGETCSSSCGQTGQLR